MSVREREREMNNLFIKINRCGKRCTLWKIKVKINILIFQIMTL
jgi:hypothetical protein